MPIARQNARTSMMSRRRSPRSHLLMKDWVSLSFSARSIWLRPARSRATRSCSRNKRYAREVMLLSTFSLDYKSRRWYSPTSTRLKRTIIGSGPLLVRVSVCRRALRCHMKAIVIVYSLLLVGLQVATAQTIQALPLTSGPCVAEYRATPNRSNEWVIFVNYQPIFTEAELSLPPFVSGLGAKPTVASSFFQRNPIFGCTTDTIRLGVFQGDIVDVATKNFVRGTDWQIEFTNQVGLLLGQGSSFPTPDGLGSVNFMNVSAFLTQGNRVIMLGDFASGTKKSSRAYDLSGEITHLFNFAGLEASSITDACITAKTLWFTVTVGDVQELFDIDFRGTVMLIATVSEGGNIGLSCGPDSAKLDIQANGALIRRSLPDRH